jgi:SAM-dependent methyltransferase
MDHITEVYMGQLNLPAKETTRNRIHWLCKQAKMTEVLDIGCSQGITSILLAREGFHALGVDVNEEALKFANEFIKSETEQTRNNVQFVFANFMEHDFKSRKFDTVILAEILEHLINPGQIVGKAASLLNTGGRVVITVPFGIMDHPDHKQTFYLGGLMKLVTPSLVVEKIDFMDEWMGIVCTKASHNIADATAIPAPLLASLEETFFKKERKLTDRLLDANKRAASLNDKIQELSGKILELNGQITEMSSQDIGGLKVDDVVRLMDSNERLNHLLDDCHMQILIMQTENAIFEEKLRKSGPGDSVGSGRAPKSPIARLFRHVKAHGLGKTAAKVLKRVFGKRP